MGAASLKVSGNLPIRHPSGKAAVTVVAMQESTILMRFVRALAGVAAFTEMLSTPVFGECMKVSSKLTEWGRRPVAFGRRSTRKSRRHGAGRAQFNRYGHSDEPISRAGPTFPRPAHGDRAGGSYSDP